MAKLQIYAIEDGYCTTTDAVTQTAMCTYDVSIGAPGNTALNNCVIFINGNSAGYDTTSTAGCGERVAAVFKVVAGVLSQVGATVHVTAMIDDVPSTPNTGFSVAGNIITYYATGSAGETIQWLGRIELHIYQPA